MADPAVRQAQRFINTTYAGKLGIAPLEEDGKTGWTVMFALTRALQFELGITSLSDSFGPTTLSALNSKFPKLNAGTGQAANINRIIQAGLYCKGYDGGGIDGNYNSAASSVVTLMTDMGVNNYFGDNSMYPKVFKALLTMDPYVVVNGGSVDIRIVQQYLNANYVRRQDFFIIPCDGHHSRNVAKSMLLAIQYELGMADGVANGNFGPGTRDGLKQHTVVEGQTSTWVYLFSAAMVLNQRNTPVNGQFGPTLRAAVTDFQSFVKLPVTGKGDFSTWASLLVSYGDQTRKGQACDGVTKITPARAASLKADGITIVGRYLTNPSLTRLPEKAIQPGELKTIADNGLRCYPIYQTFGRDASGFNYVAGRAAGYAAINAAADHGFKTGSRIYFAVDFDAYDYEVTDHVLPHFKGIRDAMNSAGNPYPVGVYGPRNVCIRVGEAGYSSASFVSDMSSGFSGNYGYPLPPDWSYDQIVTRGVGSGDGYIEIDNNIASGRDPGQNSFDPPRAAVPDKRFEASFLNALQGDIANFMQSIDFPNEGGNRLFTHMECFETIMSHDQQTTELSNRYKMRKALIQTSAYWEMRHYDLIDQGVDHAVAAYHLNGVGLVKDSSTGIAQISGEVGIRAWNHCINNGYVSGTMLDPTKETDVWTRWQQVNQDNSFSMRTVPLIHLWDAEGKIGGVNPPAGEPPLRSMRLDYNETEIYEVLRRYQGWGSPAVEDAVKRMSLYQIFEKYNGIVRNL
ncbi:glycoside hydrolase domain-containing protein [Streptomyces sp. NPDC059752]|uniref:glycoside hydrolase domain-containing protein n=1 Tax=unclassified Streptomyces TaxID=2593676 RepID=UPI003662B01D